MVSQRKPVTGVKEILEAAYAYISDPARFCTRQFEDGNGRVCSRGAVAMICGENDYEAPVIRLLRKHAPVIVARELAKGTLFLNGLDCAAETCPIVRVNDGLGHSYVLEMFREAICEAATL